jgi:N-acetylmuramoyl-L-alanine amidase
MAACALLLAAVCCSTVLSSTASAPPAPRPAQPGQPAPREFRLVLDPGHGGRGEQPGLATGDAWDASLGRFVRVLNFGGAQRLARGVRLTEHELVLALAKRLRSVLDLTHSEAGWAEFTRLLESVGVKGPLTRVRFDTRLSREDDFRAREARRDRDPSKDFRLLDSPKVFPAANGQPLHPGRVSRIVALAPELVVVLHLNDGPGTRERGTNALYVPSPEAFEALRLFALQRGPWTAELEKLRPHWLGRGRARGEKASMLESAWCYFTGYPPAASGRLAELRHPTGQAWNHVTWAYREPEPGPARVTLEGPFSGPFRERERLPVEQRRRGGGPEGVGGDNLYAGQELLRFVRLALARDLNYSSRESSKDATILAGLPTAYSLKPTASRHAGRAPAARASR